MSRVGAVGETVAALLSFAEGTLSLPGADPFLFPTKPGLTRSQEEVVAAFNERLASQR